jgi:hypothetical protein
MAERQRAFRAKHEPEYPPLVGVWLREGDAHCLAAWIVPDSVKQMAEEAVNEFWPREAEPPVRRRA